MQCDGPPCSGTQCYRDSAQQNTHIVLDGEVMQALVAYSEEGNRFESQNDVPDYVRDMIYKKDLENRRRKEDSRKRRRRGSSPSYPIQINNVWPGSEQSLALPARAGTTSKEAWRIPEPRDEAIMRYCTWHCSRVSCEAWKVSFKKVAVVTLRLGLDLKHVYEQQTVASLQEGDAGILPGIATSWIQDVKEWVEALQSLENH